MVWTLMRSIQPTMSAIRARPWALSRESTDETCVWTSITGYLARSMGCSGTTSILLGWKSSSASLGRAGGGAGVCELAGEAASAAVPVPCRKPRREVMLAGMWPTYNMLPCCWSKMGPFGYLADQRGGVFGQGGHNVVAIWMNPLGRQQALDARYGFERSQERGGAVRDVRFAAECNHDLSMAFGRSRSGRSPTGTGLRAVERRCKRTAAAAQQSRLFRARANPQFLAEKPG